MKTRWSSLTEIEVIAAYLDPRTKNILSIEETKIAESNLEKEIENMKTKIAATQQQQQQTSTTSTQEQKRYTFLRSYHQISSAREAKPSEIRNYAGVSTLALDENPLNWWKLNQHQFPLLSQITSRYLAIPATSAPVERLFSKAGAVVTTKRAALQPTTVRQLVFLSSNKDYF
jgi:hypothetical protein